jgi:hypothetical protein
VLGAAMPFRRITNTGKRHIAIAMNCGNGNARLERRKMNMSVLNFYTIALPFFDNAGDTYAEAHSAWLRYAASAAGGYTVLPRVTGVWIDDAGKRYVDELVQYQIACDEETWRELVVCAFILFPDQKAVFHARIGTATIEERAEPCANLGS